MARAADDRRTSTRRLEAFSDGVFAIAATLLVIDLNVERVGNVRSDRDLLQHLADLGPSIVSFVISFLLLCAMWAIHARQFEHIVRADGTLVMLNSLRLLTVVLIPFTTSVMAAHGHLLVGRLLLPVNFLLMVVLSAVQWNYALRSPHGLMADDVPAAWLREGSTAGTARTVVAVAVVGLAAFVGPWAFFAFFATPLVIRAMRRTSARA